MSIRIDVNSLTPTPQDIEDKLFGAIYEFLRSGSIKDLYDRVKSGRLRIETPAKRLLKPEYTFTLAILYAMEKLLEQALSSNEVYTEPIARSIAKIVADHMKALDPPIRYAILVLLEEKLNE